MQWIKNWLIVFCLGVLLAGMGLSAACSAKDLLPTGQPAQPAAPSSSTATQNQNTSGGQDQTPSSNNYASVLNSEGYDQAIEMGRAAVAASPTEANREKLADVYIARAWFYWARRLNPYTLADLTSAIQAAPVYYRAYYERGRFYNDQWQFSLGILDLDKALSMMANYAPAYSERAYSYYKNQKFDQSLADASKAIQLDPTQAGFYYNRSLAYRGLKQNDLAVADLQTVIKLSTDDALTQKAEKDLQALNQSLSSKP